MTVGYLLINADKVFRELYVGLLSLRIQDRYDFLAITKVQLEFEIGRENVLSTCLLAKQRRVAHYLELNVPYDFLSFIFLFLASVNYCKSIVDDLQKMSRILAEVYVL